MSLLSWETSIPFTNNEPGPLFAQPTVVPSTGPDGNSVFAGLTDLYTQATTDQNFYPISDSPGATGPNVVTIGGKKYVVSSSNYSAIARMYIIYQRSQGNNMYDDPTPAAYGTGQATTQGNLNTIALIDAYRQIAGLKPVNYSVDPLTGVAIPDTQTATTVLNNPVFQTVDAISNAGTSMFNAGSKVVQGGSQAITDIAGVLGSVGGFLKNPGVILVVGAGIIAFILFKKKVF